MEKQKQKKSIRNYDKRVTIRYKEIHYSTLWLRQSIQGRINIERVQT